MQSGIEAKERNAYLDLMKGIAIILVVIGLDLPPEFC